MAINTSVTSPANGTVAVNTLLTVLLAAGAVVTEWRDGTTQVTGASLTTNPFSGTGSGAGNMGNSGAGFTVRDAGSTRQWMFGRGASDTSWTVSRTVFSTPFSGGSGSTFPTSAAATALFSAASMFSATPGRMFISADTITGGWRMWCQTLGGGNVLTWLADEPLAANSYESSDTDPCLWCGYYNGTGLAAGGLMPNATSTAIVYKRFVGAGSNQRATFGAVYDPNLAGNYVCPAQSTSTQAGPAQSGKEVPLRIAVFRGGAAATTTGWIGQTSGLRWSTVGGRANGQTLYDGSSYWCYCAGIWVPWDSSTPSLS